MSKIYFNHSSMEGIANELVPNYLKELLTLVDLLKKNNYEVRFSSKLWGVKLKRDELSQFMYNMKDTDTVKPFLMAAMGNGPHYTENDVEERLKITPFIQSGTSPERILYSCLNDSTSFLMSLINEPLLISDSYKVESQSKSIEVSNIIGEKALQSFLSSSISFKTIDEVFERIEEQYSNIVILDSARKSARTHHFQGKFNHVFNTLIALEEVEMSLMADGVNDEIRKDKFYQHCGFEISGESTKTMSKPSCVRIREFVIPEKGKKKFEWHAKIGIKTRIHYYIDLESNKVYIGHCGKHLKT
ncbi:hypothetical protein ACQKJC_22340 [Priestia koreensis]|uniref:hypothetical protein n=1 Tax=Priestia koreensis TaxID=284581 RepID=UPI003CFD1791